jgi:hypothetical protein
MTEKECREQPKPDWWNPENWKNEDGTEMTSMEMEAWTQPKNPECERYYTDLLIKAQNDGKKFWCREVQVKALVATIDWFSGLTFSSSAARLKLEFKLGRYRRRMKRLVRHLCPTAVGIHKAGWCGKNYRSDHKSHSSNYSKSKRLASASKTLLLDRLKLGVHLAQGSWKCAQQDKL